MVSASTSVAGRPDARGEKVWTTSSTPWRRDRRRSRPSGSPSSIRGGCLQERREPGDSDPGGRGPEGSAGGTASGGAERRAAASAATSISSSRRRTGSWTARALLPLPLVRRFDPPTRGGGLRGVRVSPGPAIAAGQRPPAPRAARADDGAPPVSKDARRRMAPATARAFYAEVARALTEFVRGQARHLGRRVDARSDRGFPCLARRAGRRSGASSTGASRPATTRDSHPPRPAPRRCAAPCRKRRSHRPSRAVRFST